MEALLETLLSIAGAIVIGVTGYAFKAHGALQKALADAAGWKQSYDREHEATERYRKAEDQAALQRLITTSLLEALGKVPPTKEVT